MVVKPEIGTQAVAVLFSAGLDSAVLLADAAATAPAVPIYVVAGLAWEAAEQRAIEPLLAHPAYSSVLPLVTLHVDMRDVYPPTHWAIRGEAPGFDTPDEDVYLDGRNIVLLSKTAVFMARAGLSRVLIGPLAGNPFPDATPAVLPCDRECVVTRTRYDDSIDAPFAQLHKHDVIKRGQELHVPFERTLSCMQPVGGLHCGRCSKCRERRDAFHEAAVEDPTVYATKPAR